MTAPDERAFRALLRWYPRRWRDRNERVVLGTMLDAAEVRGQRIPDASMRRAAMIQGLGARLDRRTAIIAASLAVAFGLAGIPLMLAGAGSVGLIPAFGAAPLLMLFSVACTLRVRGMLSAPEALAALALAIPAAAFSTLAALSWSYGFDEADAGSTRSWFSHAFVWFVAFAWLASATWGAVVVGGMLRSLTVPAGLSRLVGGGLVFIAYPLLAFSLLSPATGSLLSLATLGAATLLTRERTAADVEPPTVRAATAPRAGRASILVCAAVSTVVGVGAIIFALTGSEWTGGALDTTEAMRVGIAAGFLAALPCCVAVWLMRRDGHPAVDAWGPPSLITAGLLIAAAENVIGGGDGNRIVWALMVAALPIGGAVAWILAMGRWAPPAVRTTIALMCGASIFVLAASIQMLPFVLPLGALVLTIGEARRFSMRRGHGPRTSRAAAA